MMPEPMTAASSMAVPTPSETISARERRFHVVEVRPAPHDVESLGIDGWRRELEAETHRELHLTGRAESHRRPTVLVRRPKVPAAPAVYGCPGCTRLASVSAALGSAFGSVPTGIREVGDVEQVEDLGTQLDVRPCLTPICFETTEIDLPEARAVNLVALEVAERARLRRRERRRIEEQQPAVLDERIHAGTRSGRRWLRDEPPPGMLTTAVRSAAGLLKTLPAPST